ncbi:hypothetical protein EBB07_00790 [Paenibacillaceae bacterium]|nr:hypothetical protein EBB07_00790 [Paenibacillaceae bacterium]
MTAFLLLKSLTAFLRQAVDEYTAAQGQGGEFRKPEVFEWNLPFKNARQAEKIDFPYIVARIINGEDQQQKPDSLLFSSVKIDLYFGIYQDSVNDQDPEAFVHPDGAYDLLNLMEYVRQALFEEVIIDNKFTVEYPYSWEIPDEQPYPLWVGLAHTTWSVQTVTRQNYEGVDLHGW